MKQKNFFFCHLFSIYSSIGSEYSHTIYKEMLSEAIVRAKSGDRDAFGTLYDVSYDSVYRMIFHRVLDDTLTEEIISDVYMKAMKSISNLRWESEWEFFSWIRQIAYTTLIDTLRGQKEEVSLENMEWEVWYTEKFSENLDDKNMIEKVLTYMQTLSERERSILTLRIWDDLSYEEISKITGESVANSKKIISRTLEKISANVHQFIILTYLFTYVISR